MKATMKLFTYGLLIFTLVLISCAKDGEVGPIGPAGIAGVDGTNGEDGNANVQIFDFDTSTETNSIMQFFMPELTTEFLKNHAVLVYAIKGDILYHMPGPILGSAFIEGSSTISRVLTREGQIIINFFDWDGNKVKIEERVGWPIDKIRIVFIEATSSETITGKGLSPTERVKIELETAGVLIDDYHSVCEYYGVCKN